MNIAFPQILLFVMLKKSNVKTYNFYTFFEQFKKGATVFLLLFFKPPEKVVLTDLPHGSCLPLSCNKLNKINK